MLLENFTETFHEKNSAAKKIADFSGGPLPPLFFYVSTIAPCNYLLACRTIVTRK